MAKKPLDPQIKTILLLGNACYSCLVHHFTYLHSSELLPPSLAPGLIAGPLSRGFRFLPQFHSDVRPHVQHMVGTGRTRAAAKRGRGKRKEEQEPDLSVTKDLCVFIGKRKNKHLSKVGDLFFPSYGVFGE
jgi:uncharacterized protein CbrC (UPF0167 family)